MKKIILLLAILSIGLAYAFMQSEPNPWTDKQLMPPAELADMLKDPGSKRPVIFNIGPSGAIRYSIEIGDTKEKENLERLKNQLSALSKDTAIVIYCGCCPFKNCPNVRPAFKLLNEMKFTNHKLLNLPKNLKTDWIDKGFPMNDK